MPPPPSACISLSPISRALPASTGEERLFDPLDTQNLPDAQAIAISILAAFEFHQKLVIHLRGFALDEGIELIRLGDDNLPRS